MDRKSNNFRSDILFSDTITKEGFDPRIIGWQKKHIHATCRYCGMSHRIYGANYRKNKTDFHTEGSACHSSCRLKEQSEAGSPFADPEIKKKAAENRTKNISQEEINKRISLSRLKCQSEIEQCNINKYGVPNVGQVEHVKKKIRDTNINKYGETVAMKNPTIAARSAERQKETIAQRGNEIVKARKETCIKKYGVENPAQLDEVKQKKENTCVERFGTPNPMMNSDIRLLAQEKMLKTHGVRFSLQDKILLEKAQNSYNKTVAENVNNNFDNINLLRGTSFWTDMEQGFSINAICEKNGVDPAAIRFHLSQDEFREKYYATYSFPKCQSQRKVFEAIAKLGCNVLFNDRSALGGLELDIFIPENSFAIEFNGSYWHSEAILTQSNARSKHSVKRKLCIDKGIRLFHLFEGVWENRENQVMGFLRSALNKNEKRIFARKCDIAEDSGKELVENNHIQGYPKNTIKSFDLVYQNSVVGSMSAAKHHRQNSDNNTIILNRLAFENNTTVIGGASKMFEAFKRWAKGCGFNRILSWSDSMWTEGNVYQKLGFKMKRESGPDYFYWDMKNNSYISKQSQRKSNTGCPSNIKERDFALQQGLYRIWDCGKKLWTYSL